MLARGSVPSHNRKGVVSRQTHFSASRQASVRILQGVGSAAPYKYILSLPERALRSLIALTGGLLREIGTVALPASIRRTALYRTMVEVALRFMIEDVGQVEGVYPAEGKLAEEFLLQRTASHGIELLGILTFHASPIWILAALADATGGGRKLIGEVADALKEEGLLEPTAHFETLDQMMDGLEKTSEHLALSLNLPPMNIAGLRHEWDRLRVELATIPPRNIPALPRVEEAWSRLREAARAEGRPVFVVSSLMAMSALRSLPANVLWLSRAARSAVRRTGKVLGEATLDHYTETLAEISRTGFAAYWSQEFRPYLRGAAEQFARHRESLTERLLRKRGDGASSTTKRV